MKRILSLLLICIAFSSSSYAFENYFTNFTTLYPSGCATLLQAGTRLQGQRQLLLPTQILPLWDANSGTSVAAQVTVNRMGCANSERSVILIKIYIPNSEDGIQSTVNVPIAFGRINGVMYPLSLQNEPNSYLISNEVMFEGETYSFFLDGPSLNQDTSEFDNILSPSQYNNGFDILLADPVSYDGSIHGYENTILPYTGNLKSGSMPINGRLSGNWVSPGANDQGFLISFNELITSNGFDSIIFISWYTFDQNGNLLWLTGNSVYEMGDHTVRVDIVLVENGEFLGAKRADREVIGYVELTAKSCSELGLSYDLSSYGLGSGELELSRILHVEIAGYACDDLENRTN